LERRVWQQVFDNIIKHHKESAYQGTDREKLTGINTCVRLDIPDRELKTNFDDDTKHSCALQELILHHDNTHATPRNIRITSGSMNAPAMHRTDYHGIQRKQTLFTANDIEIYTM
jgi:hypothetical protein